MKHFLQRKLFTVFVFSGISLSAQQWEQVPLVRQDILDKGFKGGEGGQWYQCHAVDGTGNFLIYGTDVGGSFRSEDGGKSWVPCNAGVYARGTIAVAIDPMNSKRAVLLTGNSAVDFTGKSHGMYLTSDKAKTWTLKKQYNLCGYRDHREQIAYDRSSFDSNAGYTKRIYWSRSDRTYCNWGQQDDIHPALYKSDDGGNTWNEIPNTAAYGQAIIKVHPAKGYVYAANDKGFFKSTNQGTSFTKKFTETVTGLDVIHTQADKVYITTAAALYISSDAGETFTKVNSGNFPIHVQGHTPPSFIKVSPANPNRMALQKGDGDWLSSEHYSHDGGVTWNKSQDIDDLSYIPNNSARIAVHNWHPTDQNKVWTTGGDFICRSDDGGRTVHWANDGFCGVAVNAFNFSSTHPGVVVLPTQDYDSHVTTDGGKTFKWLKLSGQGWGGWQWAAYSSNGNVAFGMDAPNFNRPYYISITRDKGATRKLFSFELFGYSTCYGDPHDSKILFCAEYRSADEGLTWTKMNGCDGVFISNPAGNKELYGLKGRDVVVSNDRGISWKVIGPVPGTSALKDIAYDHKNNKVYIAADDKFYQMNAANGQVTDITANAAKDQFGSNRFFGVACDPVDADIVYACGPKHIYTSDASAMRSVDGGKTWKSLNISPRFNNVNAGLDGGKEAQAVRVDPVSRYAFFGSSCFGTWKIAPPGTATGIKDQASVELFTVYPNPSGGNVKISFSLENSEFVKVTLHDILGRELKSIVNDTFMPGKYEYGFSVVTTGVYLIKYYRHDGNYSVKKIIIE